ncbi:MAG TPA: hypothetical protein VGP82_00415 [Ktedonobacterales bacterium]|nr:hypothetical protein [Ktedonobacterales bacterium]
MTLTPKQPPDSVGEGGEDSKHGEDSGDEAMLRRLRELQPLLGVGDETLAPTEREAAQLAHEEAAQRIVHALDSLAQRQRAFPLEQFRRLRLLTDPRPGPLSIDGVARESSAPDPGARQWDYCHVQLQQANGDYVVNKASPHLEQQSRSMENQSLDAMLAALGDDKWELAGKLGADEMPYLLFKRPRSAG